MKQEELNEILKKHKLWLENNENGQRADLRYANLSNANLSGADLSGTELSGANLSDAKLPLNEVIRKGIIVQDTMIGWKKCKDDVLVKLEIPKGAIVFSINNNKCRTNIAKVVEIIGAEEAVSQHDEIFIYKKDKTYTIEDFNLMYNIECSTGIHFFRTKEEAENYK